MIYSIPKKTEKRNEKKMEKSNFKKNKQNLLR